MFGNRVYNGEEKENMAKLNIQNRGKWTSSFLEDYICFLCCEGVLSDLPPKII